MASNSAVFPPQSILSMYGWPSGKVTIMPVQPGFSGSLVWKVQSGDQSYALKCWPAGHPVYMSLSAIHELMQQADKAGLSFIPSMKRTLQGASFIQEQGHLWDAITWMSGSPATRPSDAQLIAAIKALAQLHTVWRTAHPGRSEVCPAVTLQHQRLAAWTPEECHTLRSSAIKQPACQYAIELFLKHREPAMRQLQPWLTRKVPLHPCLADVWSDHVLFSGEIVTGVIDFGGMRLDHPAQDLARLIGSYTQGNSAQRLQALNAYAPSFETLESLTILLDDCGTVVGLGNWLRWMILDQKAFPSHDRALARMELLTQRLIKHPFINS